MPTSPPGVVAPGGVAVEAPRPGGVPGVARAVSRADRRVDGRVRGGPAAAHQEPTPPADGVEADCRRRKLVAEVAKVATVAVVMVARDDARVIERALLSAKPYVDELVVLDLGSVDDTVERAQRLRRARRDRRLARGHLGPAQPGARALRRRLERRARGAGVDRRRRRWPASARRDAPLSTSDSSRSCLPTRRAGCRRSRCRRGCCRRPVRYMGRRSEEPVVDGLTQLRTGVVVASDHLEPARWR